jgi:hypothetical protein
MFRCTQKVLPILLCLAVGITADGQARKRPAPKPQPKTAAPQPAVSALPEATPTPQASKKNERPSASSNGRRPSAAVKPTYVYEFSQPNFTVSKIRIEHDESGRGTISFLKQGLIEEESDPIMLSPQTLERINAALAALDFLNSATEYQHERDYSHLGNITFTHRKDGRERTVKYNWTDDLNARVVTDEYRKLGNQYIWQFDMQVARENQPLNAPSLMDVLDSYFRRNEISDPVQMLPLLKELADDERIPLIARNHADRLAKKLEKEKK